MSAVSRCLGYRKLNRMVLNMDKEDRTKVFMWFLLLFILAIVNAFCLGIALSGGKWFLVGANATGMLLCAYSAIISHNHIWQIAYTDGKLAGYKEFEQTYLKVKAKMNGEKHGTINI